MKESSKEAAAFAKYLKDQLNMVAPQESANDSEALDGKTREELLLMLPSELRTMIAPPKGWYRTTGRMRKLMKKEPTYLFKNTGNKSFARKEKESK